MATRGDGDEALKAVCAQARKDAPGRDLTARVLADAAAVQAVAVAVPVAVRPVTRRGWVAALVDGLGGWSAVSGITAAGVMGLAVGLYAPEAIGGLVGEDALPFSSTGYGLTPDIGGLWMENGDV